MTSCGSKTISDAEMYDELQFVADSLIKAVIGKLKFAVHYQTEGTADSSNSVASPFGRI